MAGSHGGCPFLVQMVWRHFSLELKRLGSTHTPVVSQLLLSKTSRPVVEVSTVQTLHLCLQDLLPTSAYRDILNAHLQASCRSLHCPNTSLVSPGPTPNLSLSRYPKHSKTCHLRQSIDKSPSTNDLTANMPKVKQKHTIWIKNTQVLRCPWLYTRSIPT